MIDRGTRIIVIAAMLAGTVVAQAGPAQAQDVALRYSPYELQTEAGAKAVFDRIRTAARRACHGGRYALSELHEQQLCRADLTQQIVAKLDNRRVTALWLGRDETRLASRGQ